MRLVVKFANILTEKLLVRAEAELELGEKAKEKVKNTKDYMKQVEYAFDAETHLIKGKVFHEIAKDMEATIKELSR